MTLNVFITFLVLASPMISNSCLGLPDGAPAKACASMMPGHGVSPRPLDTSPFAITVNSPYYKTGKTVQVTIASNGTTTFKGFLIQARRDENSNVSIGSFRNLPSLTELLECNSNAKGTVTHSQRLNSTKLTLEWMPPDDISTFNKISFFATVVQNKTVFWVKIPSKPLMRDASCPPGKATCTSSAFSLGSNVVVVFFLALASRLFL